MTYKDKLTYFNELIEIMERLRAPSGCPWDRKQCHLSLTPFLIEEAYEVLECIENSEDEKLKEELGDLLLQIIFHAQIASERNKFDIFDIIQGLNEKLKRRHPHIFSDKKAENAEDVIQLWEEIKLQEKGGQRKSLLDGIPDALPSLLRSERIQGRAAEVGFDWDNIPDTLKKAKEELCELEAAYISGEKKLIEDELGDVLFAIVNVSRKLEINSEGALRGTIRKFIRRFQFIEDEAKKQNINLKDMSLKEMDVLWENAKLQEK